MWEKIFGTPKKSWDAVCGDQYGHDARTAAANATAAKPVEKYLWSSNKLIYKFTFEFIFQFFNLFAGKSHYFYLYS